MQPNTNNQKGIPTKDALLDDIEKALEQAEYNPLRKAIISNYEQWETNKSGIMSLLSKHPRWSSTDLAIVTKHNWLRKLDTVAAAEMLHYIDTLPADQGWGFQDIWSPVIYYTKTGFLTEDDCKALKHHGIDAVVGKKISRAFNSACKALGLTANPQYNKWFARLADALSPIKVEGTVFLSVHPLDYLAMSRGNSWDTCQLLGNGAFDGGCLSYMNDAVSMVLYCVDEETAALPQ